ncbi:MAG TPA: flagellar basal body rod C-terminal domain-containing protein, partial [Mobilitalea sp.]|nr:flagellar basal body rod C-terminal domain-containing protein [Mobilitalea sp.]
TLHVIPREKRQNQNDIEGLYDIAWQNDQEFNLGSSTLGGALQALYEVRDGNNTTNLSGTIYAGAGDDYITMTDPTITEIERLNIPEEGKITIGNHIYTYTGFEASKDEAGNITSYTFELEEPLLVDAIEVSAKIGESIDYKGIPYYMDQMNTFIRTFSKSFNDVHRTGKDLSNTSGMDFFNATNKVNGREYMFGPLADSDDALFYDYSTFNSNTGGYAEQIPENQPMYGSYYFMTAENFTISSELLGDPERLAAATDVINGTENNDVIDKLLALKADKGMFKQGAPGSYIQSMVAEIGIDSKKVNNLAESQENILRAITNQRLSVSGVDMDEEAMNLVRFQNAYNLSAKVISVMDEIYDRLINYMGV